MTRGHLLLVGLALLGAFAWAAHVVAVRQEAFAGPPQACRGMEAASDAGCGAAWRAARERFLNGPRP